MVAEVWCCSSRCPVENLYLINQINILQNYPIALLGQQCYALASASTLNRMELGEPQKAAHERYKRMAARPEAFDERKRCEWPTLTSI